MKKIITRFVKEDSGAAMVEYAVALIVVTTIGITAVQTLGTNSGAKVTAASTAIGAPATP